MKIGVSINPMRDDIEKALVFALENFDYIELSIDGIKKEEIQNIAVAPLVVHLPFRYIAYSSIYTDVQKASLKTLFELIDECIKKGVKRFVAHPVTGGEPRYKKSIEKTKKGIKKGVEEIIEYANELGIKIYFENMSYKHPIMTKPEDFLEVGINDLCFDSCHTESCGVDSSEWIKKAYTIGLSINHIHLSGWKKPKTHTTLEESGFNLISFVNTLKTMGFDKTITFEIKHADKDALTQTRDRVRNAFKS